MNRHRTLAVLVFVAAACSGSDAAPSAEAVPSGAPVAVDPTPLLSLGTAMGDTLQEFFRVVTPFLDSNGRIVVPLAGASTIRIFEPDGEFATSLGRSGEGPGEFGRISGAWLRGDTIEVFDGELGRITRFHPDGGFDVIRIRGPVSVQGAVAGPAPDGWILHLVTLGEPESSAANPSRRDIVIAHGFAMDGAHVGEVARTRGITRYQSPVISGPEALSPRAMLSLHDGRLYVGDVLTPVIHVLEANGTPVSDITWEADPAGPLADVFAAVVDSAVARSPADRAEGVRTRYAGAPLPDRIPVWWDFVVDGPDFVWVRPYDPLLHASALGGLGSGSYLDGGKGRGGTWLIVSPSAGIVNEIELPVDFSPLQVLEDRVLGIHRDELGVESVQVLRLTRSN